jgi:hypothetical protein
MYYIWEHIMDHEDGRLRVNLLLNRASECRPLQPYPLRRPSGAEGEEAASRRAGACACVGASA